MADLIATEAYAQSIGGANVSYTPNLGCTKFRAIALGCKVVGTYTDNQLVCQKDLDKISTVTYSLRNLTDAYLYNIRVQAGSCVFTGNIPTGGVLYTTTAPSSSSWTTSNIGLNTVNPSPDPNTYSYIIQNPTTYIYTVSRQNPDSIAGNNTGVYMLSSTNTTLIGTKNYVQYLDIPSNFIIYVKANTTGYIGRFRGMHYADQSGPPVAMINGNQYGVLYTVINTSSNTNRYPAGTIIEPWRLVKKFIYNSNIYYYFIDI